MMMGTEIGINRIKLIFFIMMTTGSDCNSPIFISKTKTATKV